MEFENPYICFNCEHVGKCKKAIRHTHDPSACRDFRQFVESEEVQTTLTHLAEIIGLSAPALSGRVRDNGWGHVVELFQAKGIKIRRERSGEIDKRYKSKRYKYYMKR